MGKAAPQKKGGARKAVRPTVKKAKRVVPEKLFQPGYVDGAVVKRATSMTKEQWKRHQIGQAAKWPVPPYMQENKPNHTHFKQETYAIVTRWTAATKIEYRPHAKTPGSKSHLRYERYSAARTVGESLALGSYPIDWCWDYERGFIRVKGGPIRDEPLDAAKVRAEGGKVTDVDEAIHAWYKKELAQKLGLKPEELTKSCGFGESLAMRGHRLLAQREAKESLEAADSEGRMVTDEEVLAVLKKWAFIRNVWRQNVMKEGQEWVFSDTLGLLRDRSGDIHRTAITRRYPQVAELFARWLTDRLPPEAKEFAFTSMNVNCNYAASRHRDQGNFGPSFIKAFGDFTGGELNYWPEDTGGDLKKLPKSSVTLDLKNGLALFNGNCAHSVNDFKGARYSIVYFSVSCYPKAPADDKAKLKQLSIAFPGARASPYALLRAPRGYNSGASQGTKKDSKPAWRYWPTDQLGKSRRAKSAADIKKSAAILKKNRLAPESQRTFYTKEEKAKRLAEKKLEETDACY